MFKTKFNELSATYRIVAPLFLGDSDQSARKIRPSSVKGALRFWFRTLNWGCLRAKCTSDQEALKILHREEAELFGCAADGETGKAGQGRFLLTVDQPNTLTTQRIGQVHTRFGASDMAAARYLGYGLMEAFASAPRNTRAGQLTRDCIDEGQRFTVRIVSRCDSFENLKEALIALGLLGGLGSRNRHGMGSLSLESLADGSNKPLWERPTNSRAYADSLNKILKGRFSAHDLPPYTAFSRFSSVYRLGNENDPYKVLNGFARAMLMYRSSGQKWMVLGSPSERRFKPDHDWKYHIRPVNFHPRRVVFGLPHNYGKGADQEIVPEHHTRRASPLLFHVQALEDDTFVGVAAFLPAVFLPQNEGINAGGTIVPAHIEWSVITDFLDGQDIHGKPRFSNKLKFAVKGAILP
jgi:CRISPR-associated protein Cmr1